MSGPYRNRYVPLTHPLRRPHGSDSIGEHRVVLFDKIGPGVHPCAWCEKPVAWHPLPGQEPLEVDHIDNDGLNNAPANLAASCRSCNGRRGRSWWACLREGVEWTGSAEQTNYSIELDWARHDAQFGAFPYPRDEKAHPADRLARRAS